MYNILYMITSGVTSIKINAVPMYTSKNTYIYKKYITVLMMVRNVYYTMSHLRNVVLEKKI